MPDNQGKHDRIVSYMVRYRLWVMLFVVIGVTAFSYGITRMQTDVILSHMFPHDHPYLKLHARFAQVFGGGGTNVVIAINTKSGDIFNPQTLGKVKEMTRKIELWPEVYRLLTVSMASNASKVVKTQAKGEIVIEALMFPEVPKTEEDLALLKKHVFSLPQYDGTLVSEDGTAALVLTQMKEDISYEQIFVKLRDLVERYSDENTSIHIVGYPMLMGWIYSYKYQMYIVFAISVALMMLILFLVFRNVVGMVAPIAMSAICTALGLGFIGWTGINFSPLLYVLAFLVGARMLSNSVQITHRYIEEFRALGDNPVAAAFETMKAMMMPNAAAVATDAVGFLVLGVAKIILMQQLAILMSFWMVTIALQGVLVPIICSYLPIKAQTFGAKDKLGRLGKAIVSMANFSMGPGKLLVGLGMIGIIGTGIFQITQLKVGDPTPGSSILWPDHTYNQDQALVNEKFNISSDNLMLYYEGAKESVYEPDVLKTFELFEQHMAEELPDIYKSSSSIIGMSKMLCLTFHDGDQMWHQLPRDPKQLTGILGYVRNTAGTAVLRRFIDGGLERTQITLFFADHTSDNMLRIKKAALDFFEKHPMKIANGEFKLAGGRVGMEIALNEEMKQAHAFMDSVVLLSIFIMCSISFRSVVAGFMLTIPLVFSNLIAFSYMAWAGIGLTTSTLPCSAVGVGVGVDFAIYLYSRCKEEALVHDDWRTMILCAVRTTGKGIVFTGMTLILPILTWYFISALKFQAQMGFFLAMLLCANMVLALTLHPLIILLVKPRFMKKKVQLANQEKVASALQIG
ncbi:hypothetical protein SAMN02746065_1443 [Desulfocicer vacuolatum DSM 3385]|uniref:Membrane transport protein MMPL domain-containing protein n=1 Tax=Desulfocicer vacuolatum DSM 3385 TaxID=1121400 RepID=A0A1W2ETJ8_9BACT|nr:MMPL family transporter [Desulfocicer vacuolatum]SMD12955.1 hypothetical protein SAMN02746065_1443 [Desulfocicer vacuolatum DSM 3385]